MRYRSALLAAGSMLVAFLVSAPAASAAEALLPEHRTLFLTERFTPTSMRAPITTGVRPHQLLTLRGEREGFQLAVRNDTGASLAMRARVVPDASLAGERNLGHVDWELLRVATVTLPRGSTGLNTGAGDYADPLPPFGVGTAGSLQVAPGRWGGVVLLAKVRTDARAARHTGVLELYTGSGASEVVRARQPFSIDVRDRVLLRPGTRRSFSTVLGVEGEAYWLQHQAMRRGPSEGFPSYADRMLQLSGLASFLDSRGVTPLRMPFAEPAATGFYRCSFDSPGSVAPYRFRSQLARRYLAGSRDVDPQTSPFRTRVFPATTHGCNQDKSWDDFTGTRDPRRTPGVKQDDLLHPAFGRYVARVAAVWRNAGFFGPRTYAFNPFDEPGDATAAQRRTMDTQVPQANVLLHRALRGTGKVALTSWPRDSRSRRVCRRVNGGRRCTTLSGDTHSNRRMWDGRGSDDVDVWVAPFSRLYGRTIPRKLRVYGVAGMRAREYSNRLKAIRRAKPHKETWAYNFYTATRTMPQLSIDAPGTDARLQYWMLARDGHTGLYVSNSMLGWGSAVRTYGNGLRRKGNPWDQATYFHHRVYGYAAGWGTFLYPGYRPQLGLVGETRRNSAGAMPVTSLRMEGLRDGQEDANLVAMFRMRFGATAADRQLRTLFPGRYRALPRTLGNVVMPWWSTRNLAQRMETRRRAMIIRLTS